MSHAITSLAIVALVAGCGPKPRADDGVDARVVQTDARTVDAPVGPIDAAIDGSTSGGGLDPDLDVPPASNQPCTTPGSLSDTECPGIAVCRFFSPTEGRCESCEPCGNLDVPCNASDECDIIHTCFQGTCTNFCTLGTTECGAPADCVNIGHPTRGVCQL